VQSKLWEAGPSNFHDLELQRLTQQINKLVDGVERTNVDSSRHLHWINFESRLMLVWCDCAEKAVSSSNVDEDIAKAFKVKGYNRR
jgi:hypothetical protein